MLCVFTAVCVCALEWVKFNRARIPSMGHHTWLYVTSLSLKKKKKIIKENIFIFIYFFFHILIILAKMLHYQDNYLHVLASVTLILRRRKTEKLIIKKRLRLRM